MALKQYKPDTPGQRGLILVDRSQLWKGEPVKSLTEGLRKKGGRNNQGHITARRRGGGHKRRYRMIDFKRAKLNVKATVERIEYDPNRTAFIALLKYEDGELAYILAPQRLAVGDEIVSGTTGVDIKPGNAMPMAAMPVGTIIHNVEMKQGKGGQMARSAGTYAQIIGKDQGYAQVRLSSGEIRLVRAECMATVGAVSARKRLAICHGAGLRNAVFDATFFGTEHAARRYGSLPPEATYALGAVAAITLDFPLDVALKRNMAAPTTSPVPRVGATLLAFRLLRDRGFRVVFTGLGVKSCEFGVSYACTGYVSTFFR